MPQPPILELSPNWGATERYVEDVYVLSLGDRYKQITSGGTTSQQQEWDISYVGLTSIEVNSILEQLEGFAGVSTFQWRPNDSIPYEVYTCTKPSIVPEGDNVWRINAVFKRDASGQCIQFLTYIDEAKIKGWLNGLDAWLTRVTRNSLPLICNTVAGQPYLLVNSFHDVLGRGGYFPASAGTSEGQFLMIRAAMLAFQQTQNFSWYNRAIQMARSLEPVFYGQSVPANTNTLWVPHWLINVKYPFTSKGRVRAKPLNYGYFDVVVNFTNGVGRIPIGSPNDGQLVSNVYTVYPMSARLLWQNVFAPVIFGAPIAFDYWVSNYLLGGQNYRVFATTESSAGTAPVPTGEPAGTIKLSTNFTGQLKICYSAYSGAVVPTGDRFDAYPVWRTLLSGEYNCAFDSLPWAYDAFDELLKATGDQKWARAMAATQYSTTIAAEIPNLTHFYKLEDNEFPFSYPGSQVVIANNNTQPIASRVTSGNLKDWLRVDVTAPTATNQYPSAEFQNFAVKAAITKDTTIRVNFAHSRQTMVEVSVSTNPDPFNLSETYIALWLIPAGTANPSVRTFLPGDFYRWRRATEYLVWHPLSAEGALYAYSGMGGTAIAQPRQVTIAEGDKNYSPVVWELNLDPGSSGFAGGGYVLTGLKPTRPPLIRYRLTGNNAQLRIRDANNNTFTKTLPQSNEWTEVQYLWSDFSGSGDPNNSEPILGIDVQAFAGSPCVFYAHWLATNDRQKPERLPVPVETYKASIVTRDRGNYSFYIGTYRPINSPSDDLPYVPGVYPYTVNTVNGVLDAWRGIPMSGYQDPLKWANWGLRDRAKNVVQFQEDAQAAYAEQNINRTFGAFAPAFSYARWDAGDYLANGINQFGWSAPDPNTPWEGYQHRAIEAMARYWWQYPSDSQAGKVVMNFLGWYDSYCLRKGSYQPPTNYDPLTDPLTLYHTPHGAALILRAALYANMAGGSASLTFRLIKRNLEYLESQYQTSGNMAGCFGAGQPVFTGQDGQQYNEFFGFWAAEIALALSEVLKYKNQINLPTCDSIV